MLKIFSKNGEILIDENASIRELILNKKLLSLSADEWDILLLNKGGYYDLDTLKYVLIPSSLFFADTIKLFNYKNKKFWIDKETRNSLFNLLNSLDESSNFDLIVGDEIVILSVSKAKDFLTLLEQYASACKVLTIKHIKNIKDIKKFEDLLKYDYKLGYPDYINLNNFIN